LGRRFGKVHRLDVATPAEAIHALTIICPGLRECLIDAEHQGIGHKIFIDHAPIRDASRELGMAHGPQACFAIAPVISGAKSGLGQVIVGVLIVVAAFYSGGASLSMSAAWEAGGVVMAGYVGAYVGAALIVGGISQMIAPQQPINGTSERPENKPSYVFNGAVNTTQQGGAVAVGYGRLFIGSQVISMGLFDEDIPL
jgi:predicted phage tail protein